MESRHTWASQIRAEILSGGFSPTKEWLPSWYGKLPVPKAEECEEFVSEDGPWSEHNSFLINELRGKVLDTETLLFHSSSLINPVDKLRKELSETDTPFYFGLDSVISLHYVEEAKKVSPLLRDLEVSSVLKDKPRIERIERGLKMALGHPVKKNWFERLLFFGDHQYDADLEKWKKDELDASRRYYFLNVYRPKMKIAPTLVHDNPRDESECIKGPCVHPEIAFHGNGSKMGTLCTEFTLPSNKTSESVEFISAFVVDVRVLEENAHKTLSEFFPTDAIVL